MSLSRSKVQNLSSEICADCSAHETSWASVNRGVLLCSECSSVHRCLGRSVSLVKPLKNGNWHPNQLAMVHSLYSRGSNHVWEHSLIDSRTMQVQSNPKQKRKPNPRDQLYPTKADFIRSKYQHLSFIHRPERRNEDDLNRQLYSCVRTIHLETTLRLLGASANPNYYDPKTGATPLHIAAKEGQSLQVELLAIYGADPASVDLKGETPSDYARKENCQDLANRITELQYEVTDQLTQFLCGKRPDHRSGQHFVIPEVSDIPAEEAEIIRQARYKLQILPNDTFEHLVVDAYEEMERRLADSPASRAHQDPSSEKYLVPFLPVNQHYTTTRNQSRQKLAKFSAREFASFIIDILAEVKRRQFGSAFGASGTPAANAQRRSYDPKAGRRHQPLASSRSFKGESDYGTKREKRSGSTPRELSSREKSSSEHSALKSCDSLLSSGSGPLYDEVPDETERNVLLQEEPFLEALAEVSSVKDPDDQKSSDENEALLTSSSKANNNNTSAYSDRSVRGSVPSNPSEPEIVNLEEYEEMKLKVANSELQLQELASSNEKIKTQLASLEEKVEKLTQINEKLVIGLTTQTHSLNVHPPISSSTRPQPPPKPVGEMVKTESYVKVSERVDETCKIVSNFSTKNKLSNGTSLANGQVDHRGIKGSNRVERPGCEFDPKVFSQTAIIKTEQLTAAIHDLLQAAQKGHIELFPSQSSKVQKIVDNLVSLLPYEESCVNKVLPQGSKVQQCLRSMMESAIRLTIQSSKSVTELTRDQFCCQVVNFAYDVAKNAKVLMQLIQ